MLATGKSCAPATSAADGSSAEDDTMSLPSSNSDMASGPSSSSPSTSPSFPRVSFTESGSSSADWQLTEATSDWRSELASEWQSGRRMARASQRNAMPVADSTPGASAYPPRKATALVVPSILFERLPEDGVAQYLQQMDGGGSLWKEPPLLRAPHRSTPRSPLVSLW